MSCNQQPESSYQTEPEYIHPIQFNSSGIHYSPSSLKQSKVFGFLLEYTSLHGRFFPQLKEPSADQMQTFCYLNLKTFHALHLGTMRRFGQRSKVWFLEHEEELNHACSIDYDLFFFWTCKWTNKYVIVMSFHNPFLCSRNNRVFEGYGHVGSLNVCTRKDPLSHKKVVQGSVLLRGHGQGQANLCTCMWPLTL